MENKRAHRVFVGRTDTGRPAVASASSPFFLFEADTEDAALEKAKRALDFYFKAPGSIVAGHREVVSRSISRFYSKRSEEIYA